MQQDREDLLLPALLDFFKLSEHLQVVSRLVGRSRPGRGEAPISLRLVDWFCCNYSKKNHTTIRGVHVHDAYRGALKGLSKSLFDVFARTSTLTIDGNIRTSVAQLSFFRWAIERGVIEYCEKNRAAIVADLRARRPKPQPPKLDVREVAAAVGPKRRRVLTPPPPLLSIVSATITISF